MSIETRLSKLEEQAAKVVESKKLNPQEIVDKIESLFRNLTERKARLDAGLESCPTSPNTSGVDCKALAAKICGMYELAKLQIANGKS